MSVAQKHIKIKLREVNRHLVCRLCRGYYVDATTIAECLHSFCRSCIIKYLEKNSFCPICEVQIHKTKPYLNLRLDKALQDVVYKLVPGLYHDEMKRRRDFYSKRQEQIPFATPEQCGLEERIIFSPEDSISLSLEYLESDDYESETVSSQSSESGDNPDVISFPQQLGLIRLKNGDGKASRRESQDVQDMSFLKRYLQCPAVVNVGHLKKFIKMKHDLMDKAQVSVIHKRVPLPDHYTLMDVAYIYTWKRSAPLRLFYQIYQAKQHKLRPRSSVQESKENKPQTAAEDFKVIKSEVGEKHRVGDINRESVEGCKNSKSSADRNDSLVSDVKLTVCNNVLKHVDGNKSLSDTGTSKSAVIKSESGVPSVIKEVKEEFGTGLDTSVLPRNNKIEKSKSVGIIGNEEKNKVESQKRKSGKVEINASAQEVKDNKSNNKRLLLNPISGQLETVPSNDPNKPSSNGKNFVEETKDSTDSFKSEITNKAQKKTDLQSTKDTKKSNVNLLKSFRKEKFSSGKEGKVEIKNSRGNSLTITPVPNGEKPPEKETAKFSVEIKAENKESEYDFDGSSPPSKIIPLQEFSKYSKYSKYMADHRDKWLSKESKNSWMSLQDFREKMLKENNSNEKDSFKKNKKKLVPSLYKINSEGNKAIKRTPNGKLTSEKQKAIKIPRTVINIQTETENKKAEVKVEVFQNKSESPARPKQSENKDKVECKVKQENDENFYKKENVENKCESKKEVDDGIKANCADKEPLEDPDKQENEDAKGHTPKAEPKNELPGAIDLSKGETSPKSGNPSENLMDFLSKTGIGKSDEKMMEALIIAAQKQNIEPLLKIPQYSQLLKNSVSPGSHSPAKSISSNDISQALQFLEDLRSDIKVFEAKNQLNPNSVLEQFAQTSGNFQPYQELYQQKIDLIRRLKRHQQITPGDSDTPQRKLVKLSSMSESKKKLSPDQKAKTSAADEAAQYKSSVDKTLSQIQLMELQTRMLAAHNYKNLPALLQYYNRPLTFCAGPTSPNKSNQQKTKPSSHTPNSSKSPQSLGSPSGNASNAASNSDSSFFNSQNYLINAGLNSEMTYHQMFQSYLNQQEQMNQVKLSQIVKKPLKFNEVSSKSLSNKYFIPQATAKKQESNNSIASAQKT